MRKKVLTQGKIYLRVKALGVKVEKVYEGAHSLKMPRMAYAVNKNSCNCFDYHSCILFAVSNRAASISCRQKNG